jgi:hypothetical protein
MKHPVLFAVSLFALVGVASGAVGACLVLRAVGGATACATESEHEVEMRPALTANLHLAPEMVQ